MRGILIQIIRIPIIRQSPSRLNRPSSLFPITQLLITQLLPRCGNGAAISHFFSPHYDRVLRKIPDALLPVLLYNISMKKKPLSQTNPYLLDRDERRAALIRTTVSSSAIEGIRYSAAEIDASILEPHTPEKLKKRTKSGEARR
jgi:hypothetical protein